MFRPTTVTQTQNMQWQALTWANRRFICFVGFVRGGTHVRSKLRSRFASGGIRLASNCHSSDCSGYQYQNPPISEQPHLTNQFMLDKIKYSDLDVKEEIDPKILNDSRIRQNVHNTAIKFLAARAFPASALRHKLIDKKFPVKIIDIVMDDLERRRLLNDSHYAESFSQSRWLSLSWGPRKIKRALVQKGISEDVASKAASQVFMDEESSENSDGMLHGMSKITLDRLFNQASKHWLKGCDRSLENRKSGMFRWLQYRGFNWGVTDYILKKLELEHPCK